MKPPRHVGLRLGALGKSCCLSQHTRQFFCLSHFSRLLLLPAFLLACLLCCPQRGPAQEKVALQQTPAAVKNGRAQFLGPYNPDQKLRLVFALQPPHLQEEEQFLDKLQDRDSPLFHKYLSAEEWNDRFAPSPQAEQAVVDWAASQGLTITQRYPNRLLVDVEATTAIIEKALDVAINRYQDGSTQFYSNDRDPSVPAQFAAIIHSLLGLNSLEVMRTASRTTDGTTYPDYSPGPVYTIGTHLRGDGSRKKLEAAIAVSKNGERPSNPDNPYYWFTPSDIYSPGAYDYQPLANLGHCCNPLNNPGNSPPEASIAIAIWGDFSDADLDGFLTVNPYLAHNVQRYFIDGTPPCCSPETTLDVEWTTATANSFQLSSNTAEVHVYEGVNYQVSTLLDVLNRVLSDGHARVLSMSWGEAELYQVSSQTMDSYHAVFNQMAGQGWSLVAASGDAGATTDCADHLSLSYPASDPDVTAAGGTTLTTSYYGYSTETGWTGGPSGCAQNDGGGGGGCSAYFAAPSYQLTPACGSSSRSVPDMALNADWVNSPQEFFFNASLQGSGGTSIVAPEIAGFYAQENAYLLYLQSIIGNTCGGTLSSPCAPMGNANYYLYGEGGGPEYAPHNPFYDVTSGCNNNDITQEYGLSFYCASTGYDMVTGWGSANMFQLAWSINNYLAGDAAGPSIAMSGPLKNHWYNTYQTIGWTITDATGNGHLPNGVAGYNYYLDSDPGDLYSQPAGSYTYAYFPFYSGPQYPNDTIGAATIGEYYYQEGCHTVIVRAWDNAGQPSVNSYGPVCVDESAPYTYVTLLGTGQYPNYIGPVQVLLTAYDDLSGVASTVYQVDGGAWQTYVAPFNVATPGNHTVSYYSTDLAGNIEQTQSVNFTITSNTTFTLTVSTAGSGGGLISSGDGDIYCGSICSHVYYDGTQVTLTATQPKAPY